jgi:hypothetical protein
MNKFQIAQRNATIALHKHAIRVELARHPEVKNILMLFPPAMREEVRLEISGYTDTVNLMLTLRDLDSFKDKALTKLLTKFASDDAWQARTVDYTHSETPNRDFTFTRDIPWTPKPSKHTKWIDENCGDYHIPQAFRIHVSLYTYVKSDSPTCRIVVKGIQEEIVRKEITEIVCE